MGAFSKLLILGQTSDTDTAATLKKGDLPRNSDLRLLRKQSSRSRKKRSRARHAWNLDTQGD